MTEFSGYQTSKPQGKKLGWEDDFDAQFLVATSNPMTNPVQRWMANDTPTPEELKAFIRQLLEERDKEWAKVISDGIKRGKERK